MENPVLPNSFTQIYILFLIGFHIAPPKMHRRFGIGLPKIHRRFRICPPQVTLNLFLPEFQSRWNQVYHGYYARKAIKTSYLKYNELSLKWRSTKLPQIRLRLNLSEGKICISDWVPPEIVVSYKWNSFKTEISVKNIEPRWIILVNTMFNVNDV